MSIAAQCERADAAAKGDASDRLFALKKLAARDIVSPAAANLSRDLHALFDPICDDALPIYFGPLLGRLFLEGF